jgi:hypothetical protein
VPSRFTSLISPAAAPFVTRRPLTHRSIKTAWIRVFHVPPGVALDLATVDISTPPGLRVLLQPRLALCGIASARLVIRVAVVLATLVVFARDLRRARVRATRSLRRRFGGIDFIRPLARRVRREGVRHLVEIHRATTVAALDDAGAGPRRRLLTFCDTGAHATHGGVDRSDERSICVVASCFQRMSAISRARRISGSSFYDLP